MVERGGICGYNKSMSRNRPAALFLAALVLSTAPGLAAPQTSVAPPKPSPIPEVSAAPKPIHYVQMAKGTHGAFIRTLCLFGNNRAVLTTSNVGGAPATVQTGTWKGTGRAGRLTLSLTRLNGNPRVENISMIGKPDGSGALTGAGRSGRGVKFAPRPANHLAAFLEPHRLPDDINDGVLKIEADGVTPAVIPHTNDMEEVNDGSDVVYWNIGDTPVFGTPGTGKPARNGSTAHGGQSLFYFDTLTGTSRKLAAFPMRIENVRETRAASGRPVLIVSLVDHASGIPSVAVVDPLRDRVVKRWDVVRVGAIRNGTLIVDIYSPSGIKSRSGTPKPAQRWSVPLDPLLDTPK